MQSYELKNGDITCLRCGVTSHNPNDALNLYCGNCKQFHEMGDDPLPDTFKLIGIETALFYVPTSGEPIVLSRDGQPFSLLIKIPFNCTSWN